MDYIKLFEQYHNDDNFPMEFNKLKEIALKHDKSETFAKELNYNELGHDIENSFLGERFLRLNRGYTLGEVSEFESYDMNDVVTVYRTGDSPIVWGDYVYMDYNDAKSALEAGQGEKVYSLDTTYNDLIYATQGSGEFFYSPSHLRNWSGGERLQDFWYKVTNKTPEEEFINDNEASSNIEDKSFEDKVIELINSTDDWDEFESAYFDLARENNENPFQFEIDKMWYGIKN